MTVEVTVLVKLVDGDDEQVWHGTWNSAPTVGDTLEIRSREHGGIYPCYRVLHVHRIMFDPPADPDKRARLGPPYESGTTVYVEEIGPEETEPVWRH